jgi:hypothetical protein
MKNLTRLALAFAVATIAALAPMAHADDQTLAPSEPGVSPVRYYEYADEDGKGAMLVQDGPESNGSWPISVTIYQNGHVFRGKGTRSRASEETRWSAWSEFWVYGSRISAKFSGYIPIKPGYGFDGGAYYLNGSGSPYPWQCTLN